MCLPNFICAWAHVPKFPDFLEVCCLQCLNRAGAFAPTKSFNPREFPSILSCMKHFGYTKSELKFSSTNMLFQKSMTQIIVYYPVSIISWLATSQDILNQKEGRILLLIQRGHIFYDHLYSYSRSYVSEIIYCSVICSKNYFIHCSNNLNSDHCYSRNKMPFLQNLLKNNL